MTDETPEETPEAPKKSGASKAAIGAAATIGSAAIAAALLYVGRRSKQKPKDSAIGADQADTAPSGEPPETD